MSSLIEIDKVVVRPADGPTNLEVDEVIVSPSDGDLSESPSIPYDHLRITSTTDVTVPIPVLSIGAEVIATNGNILTISGVPKGGKSAFSSVLLAGALSGDGKYEGFDGVYVRPNPEGLAVLHFDTEQAKHQQKRNVQSILQRLGLSSSPDNFLSFNLRQANSTDYQRIVSEVARAASVRFGGIHLIAIDGAADFLWDVNDQVASNGVVRFLEKLAIDYQTVVLVVIHTNPGGEKERGHLGSQLQRKSESVITVKYQGGISYLEPKLLRLANKEDVPPIQFVFDKNKGYHTTSGIPKVSELEAKRVFLNQLSSDVFSDSSAYKYREAIEQIMKHTGKGERLSKEAFKELKAHGFIVKNQNEEWQRSEIPQSEGNTEEED